MAKKPRYDMEKLFQALGNETRLRLLNLMGGREVCVCELVEALELPQPKISQHLACLRSVGVVEARREGKWMHYRIVTPPHDGAEKVLRATLKWLKKDRIMLADRGKLTPVCCAASVPEER
jgi:ArsR family transcriptional regulator, arsenate/arsenite/antimonite-responsive transcriptional repressor